MDFRRNSLVAQPLSATSARTIKLPYLATLRPRQWTKNLVVFAAPLFAFSINLSSLLGSLLAFLVFCCTSSSFYPLNDIADVKSDRQHPVKCQRLLSDPEEIARRTDIGVEQGGRSERPEEILLKDLSILVTVGGWVFTCLVILWLKHRGWIE
ncbi:hypothetical protein ACE1AT_24225 [Pelatocladus sp. BLCC-F211]|uniref:hypothetical protein n=1 Tax=Pelatocladus sp. BLCC-F211 TaxID=3342752 RepID=UPI0035B9315E